MVDVDLFPGFGHFRPYFLHLDVGDDSALGGEAKLLVGLVDVRLRRAKRDAFLMKQEQNE